MGKTFNPFDSPRPQIEDVEKAVYDGDINTSIQSKFSAYINAHYPTDDYVLYRTSQYMYRCLIGSWDGSKMNDCTIIEYNTYNYNDRSTWTVTQSSAVTPDLSGDTAFVYSSVPAYPALSGVAEYRCTRTISIASIALCACLVGFLLYKFIVRGLSHNES